MSRETDRQKQRLINLANFIEKNPHLYKHEKPSACIVGLGNRLVRGKLRDAFLTVGWASETLEMFKKRYGVSDSTASDLFWGRFNKINRKQRDWNIHEDRVPVKSAVAVLRYLTK